MNMQRTEGLSRAHQAFKHRQDKLYQKRHKHLMKTNPEYRAEFNHYLEAEACKRGAAEGVRLGMLGSRLFRAEVAVGIRDGR